jgi:diadenosine tetraphosphatase ApaH/serine/threonine PP2A family protein phosphatase
LAQELEASRTTKGWGAMRLSRRSQSNAFIFAGIAAVLFFLGASPSFLTPIARTFGYSQIESEASDQLPRASLSSYASSTVAVVFAAAASVFAARRSIRPSPRAAVLVRRAEEIRQLRPRDRSDGHGWVKEDPTFNDSDQSLIIATHTVQFKKRPSGIKRYTHTDGKGAMVAVITEKARYPGDPLGQAAVAGVKKGYVVKSVAGTDVRGWDFEDIMDLLEDFVPDPDVNSTAAFKGKVKRERKHKQVDFPVTIEFMELKEGASQAASGSSAPAVPAGAWMPRLSGWSDEDLAKERQRVLSMPEPAGYSGPRYSKASDISDSWLRELMEMQKNGRLLPKKDAYLIALDIIDVLKRETTVRDVKVSQGQSLTVFGDLHGQYYDLMNILSLSGMPSASSLFLFNGDFVDRGSWSIEVLLLLFSMKLKDPTCVFFNRGNHEMLEANLIYGFAGETGAKYDLDLFNLFSEAFRNLPLLHLVNNEVLVVHAGLPGPRPRVWLPGQTHDPEDAVPPNVRACTLQEIRSVDRYTELTPNSYKAAVDASPRQEEKWETDSRMIIDFLWSDPRGGSGYGPSYRKSRGVFMFGPDVTEQFVRENNLKLVIRSHEVKAEGYMYDHPTLLSVFSAPNYLDTGGNKGAFLRLTPGAGGSLQVTPTNYKAVPHPDLKPMHHQDFIAENHPHLTRQMKKKVVDSGNDAFGDSDFSGYQAPDEWEEVEATARA